MKQKSKERTFGMLHRASQMTAGFAALALAFALAPPSLHAQSAASVSGTVTDTTGAVISGAKIVLLNSDTNIKQITLTNGSGAYSIIHVEPGNYSMEVTKSGFQAASEKSIVLSVNQPALFNFSLTPGSVQQTVTVSASPGHEQTTGATLGTVIATKSVNDLPLNGRNFTQMLELTPGVSRISVSQAVKQNGGQTSHILGAYTLPAVNGQRNRANMFLMDGANDLNSFNGAYNYQPIVDDIQEFKVQSHSDLAEFGQVTGGIVNVVTKSGTNQFHGSLWEFLRNSVFDARDYFQSSVNPLRQNQFGGTVGGPVWIPHLYDGKNRTFFFFAYEGWRQSQQQQSTFTTPTPAQLTGDFSNLLATGVKIYNPFSTQSNSARTVFPNNQIPASLLSNASLVYAKAFFPAPQSGVINGNAYNNTPLRTNSDSFTGRLDQAFGAHDFVFVRASSFNEPYTSTGGVPGVLQSAVVRGYNVTAHEVHTFGPTATLEGFFTRNVGDLATQIAYPTVPSDFVQTLISAGFSSTFLTGYVTPSGNNLPGIGVTGYLGVNPAGYSDQGGSDTYEYGGAFSKVAGRHTFKTGAVLATNNRSGTIAQNSETMTSFQTSNLQQSTDPVTKAPTGDALASFLLGAPNAALRRSTAGAEHDAFVTGAYLQDQIKLTPRLALNLGVRWDATIWPTLGYLSDGTGYVGNLDMNNGIYYLRAIPPACSSTQGAPCIPGGVLPANVELSANPTLHDTDFGNWQGRVGVAYQLSPNTSIHAGYGRFYDEWSFVSQNAQSVNGQWPSVSLLSVSNLNGTTVTDPIGDPLHLGTTTIQPAANPFNNSGAFSRVPNLLTPYTDEWNLGIEQGFGANTKLSVIYVGSNSKKLILAGYANTATYAGPGTKAEVALRRPFPYITPAQYYDNRGTGNYNGLQAALNQRTSNGLTYLVSYTYSKSIDMACSGSVNKTACLLQNWYDPEADRSVSAYDLTHMLSASAVYELPYGPGRTWSSHNALVNYTLGGWQLNTIVSLSSGTPYSVTVNGDLANTGNTFVQANQIGNPNPQHRSVFQWINPAAFQAPSNAFGDSPRDAFRSNWYRDVDLSIFKQFPLTERASLQFRAEAFNLTNTTVFDAPNSVMATPNFGAILDDVSTPREMQFALKLQF